MVEHIPGVSAHAQKRMLERHGMTLTRAEWLAIVTQILERKGVLIATHPRGARGEPPSETWAIEIRKTWLSLCWVPGVAVISTVREWGHTPENYAKVKLHLQRRAARRYARDYRKPARLENWRRSEAEAEE